MSATLAQIVPPAGAETAAPRSAPGEAVASRRIGHVLALAMGTVLGLLSGLIFALFVGFGTGLLQVC